MAETGVEIGAVGRWASHILDENGEVIEAEWSEVKKAIDFGAALGAKHYLCSVAYVPQLTYYKNITARDQGAEPDRRVCQGAQHAVRDRQLHDGRQLHPHAGAVEARARRGAGPRHQVRSFAQLRARPATRARIWKRASAGATVSSTATSRASFRAVRRASRRTGRSARSFPATRSLPTNSRKPSRRTAAGTTTRRPASTRSTGAPSSRSCTSTAMTATSRSSRIPRPGRAKRVKRASSTRSSTSAT